MNAPISPKAPNQAATRYIAVWLASWSQEDADAGREGTYGSRSCATFKEAERIAIERGKAANACEWIQVREEEWNKKYNRWESIRRWTGDYDGVDPNSEIVS